MRSLGGLPRGQRRRRGFSFVEILVALVIITLAMVPFILSMRTSSRSVTTTREYLAAVALAQRTLEQIRLARFRKLVGTGAPATPQPGNLPIESIDELAGRLNGSRVKEPDSQAEYTLEVTLHPPAASSADPVARGRPDLRTVQIAIRWKARGGVFAGEQRYELYSLVGSALRP